MYISLSQPLSNPRWNHFAINLKVHTLYSYSYLTLSKDPLFIITITDFYLDTPSQQERVCLRTGVALMSCGMNYGRRTSLSWVGSIRTSAGCQENYGERTWVSHYTVSATSFPCWQHVVNIFCLTPVYPPMSQSCAIFWVCQKNEKQRLACSLSKIHEW
jgi:hypothetical protein